MLAGCAPPFYLAVAGAAGQLAWQLRTVRLDDRASCWRTFRSNKWLGALIAAGFAGDYLWRVQGQPQRQQQGDRSAGAGGGGGVEGKEEQQQQQRQRQLVVAA